MEIDEHLKYTLYVLTVEPLCSRPHLTFPACNSTHALELVNRWSRGGHPITSSDLALLFTLEEARAAWLASQGARRTKAPGTVGALSCDIITEPCMSYSTESWQDAWWSRSQGDLDTKHRVGNARQKRVVIISSTL